MRNIFFILLLFFSQNILFAQDYNILNYGANPDGKTLNTVAIQSAIDAATKDGGGRVVIPSGQFLSGTIFIKSNVELHLEKNATLLGSIYVEDYYKLKYWKTLVISREQNNISISGKGSIDGQGRQLALRLDSLFYAGQLDSSLYNFVEKRPRFNSRPVLINFFNCKNVSVKNVSLKNAACWVQDYERCENLTIDSIQVISDTYWNNDGIDIIDCKNVRLTNSFFNCSDDGICIKSHSDKYFCDSIYVANCTVRSSASAVKFGTKSLGGFKNVVIENIKVYDTFRSAIAIESVDGGFLENVLIDNVTATNTGNAIFIKLGHRVKKEPVGNLKNVVIKNVKAEVAFERPDYNYEVRGPALPFFHNTFPSSITGIPGHPVENLTLENIEIIYPGRGNKGLAYAPFSRLDLIPEKETHYPEFSMFGELPAWGFYVRHMNGLTMKNIKLKIKDPDYRPALVFDDVQNLNIETMTIDGDRKDKKIILHDVREVKVDEDMGVFRMK